jgi:hypothetical protein
MPTLPAYHYTYKNRIRALMEMLLLQDLPAEDWRKFWLGLTIEARTQLLNNVK